MAEPTTRKSGRAVCLRALGTGALSLLTVALCDVSSHAAANYNGSLFLPSGNYLAGRLAGRDRDNATAAEYYNRALRADPDNPVILERTFLLKLSSGDIATAERLAEQVVGEDNRNRMARVVLGLKEMKAGDYAKAREHWQAGAHGSIGLLTGSLLAAWSHAGDGNTAEALKALEKLEGTDAFGIYRILHSALTADLGGDHETAKKFFEEAYSSAGSLLRVVQLYGNFLERTGEPEKAREIYDTYFKASNNDPIIEALLAEVGGDAVPEPMIPNAGHGAAEALFGLARALAEESGVDLAIIFSQMALYLKPDFPIALSLLGDIYESVKLYAQAVDVYQQIPEDSPLHTTTVIRTALSLNDLDRLDEAKETLNGLIEQAPDIYEPHFTMANILRGRSKFAEAAEYYTKAIDLLTEVEERHWALLYFRGICYERIKEWPKAEVDFRKSLELRPNQPLVLNYLGYSWIEQRHNLTEAMRMIRKAVELRPNDGYIVDSLGWAHFQLKEYDEAVKQLERAVELRPEDPVINEHLGDAYWHVGREHEARFQWNHARDFDPEPEVLERVLLKIKNGILDDLNEKAQTVGEEPDKS